MMDLLITYCDGGAVAVAPMAACFCTRDSQKNPTIWMESSSFKGPTSAVILCLLSVDTAQIQLSAEVHIDLENAGARDQSETPAATELRLAKRGEVL